jgi:riboflavin kinase/FMN adenylyltransferase
VPAAGEATSIQSRAGSVVVIGNFDGVHRGHRAVVQATIAEAQKAGLDARALTFHPHPQQVLGRGARPALTRIERKLALLARMGIEVVVEPFTHELAALSPREFAERILCQKLSAKTVLVGENFRFGHGRSGDFAELSRLGERFGFAARAQTLAGDAEGLFSSTRIREALARGDLAAAERCLGRPHSLSGVVIRGDGRGRTIGIPTANLSQIVEVLPPQGVYSCLVDQESSTGPEAGAPRALAQAVVNIGVRPTVEAGFAVEAHLLDFDGDLYGARLRLHFVSRLRDELKFRDLSSLGQQIQRDIAGARSAMSGRLPDPEARGGWA